MVFNLACTLKLSLRVLKKYSAVDPTLDYVNHNLCVWKLESAGERDMEEKDETHKGNFMLAQNFREQQTGH